MYVQEIESVRRDRLKVQEKEAKARKVKDKIKNCAQRHGRFYLIIFRFRRFLSSFRAFQLGFISMKDLAIMI